MFAFPSPPKEHAPRILLKLSSCVSCIVQYAKVLLLDLYVLPRCSCKRAFLNPQASRLRRGLSCAVSWVVKTEVHVRYCPLTYPVLAHVIQLLPSCQHEQARRQPDQGVDLAENIVPLPCYPQHPSLCPPKMNSDVGAYAGRLMSFHSCHLYLWTWRFQAWVSCSEWGHKIPRYPCFHLSHTKFFSPMVWMYLFSQTCHILIHVTFICITCFMK